MKNVSLAQPIIGSEMVDAVATALKHVIGVNSGISVFQLSLLASGLRDVGRD